MPGLTLPTLTREDAQQPARVLAAGDWVAAALAQRAGARRLLRQLQGTRPDAAWDLSAITRLDHIGAQLLWDQWRQRWPEQLQIGDAHRDMIERVAEFTTERPARQRASLGRALDSLGTRVLHALDHLQHLVQLIGQLLLDVLRLLRQPARGPWRDISGHLFRMGATALPITALVGFLIGVVLAYLMSLQLRQFGAEAFIVNILGISLIRELGPMLGAILVAGRSGSAITAQIGVMRVTEELDAMRVMGIPHGFRLVMPRALALGVAMPLIALWTTLAALAGGMLAADLAMGISPAYFAQALPNAVGVANLWLAMAKSVVFGIFIALIGCHWGLRVEPNTQSLGQGTTASVVSAITMVIIVDALFAVAFKNVGF
ncbi:phospholipid/cholesterol/gamma-HCH transport system permease protein [Oryzisolibacter propanilivorax]|uniref:Phospholipid/cholesterol/gamma-HCH transport system permease protein n=1 Tax=Oryzisolibacter propanilivorax TaxID=1527607 RepID=A0A1G9QUA7_9BURK|nr:ABC transporter permease [Oryzisolibacter propanilivorax]SDM13835.1 phospholipid/cholesterol/gamma-HCH transport system permease protein [Oryzisolibacter propanilivorax]